MDNKKPLAATDVLFYALRFIAILAIVFIFIPKLNPARISPLISRSQSMLTSGLSFTQLTSQFIRPISKGWITRGSLRLLFFGCMGGWIGVLITAFGASLTLGELKLKRLSVLITGGGAVFSLLFISLIFRAYNLFLQTSNPDKIQPQFSNGLAVFFILEGAVILFSAVILLLLPKADGQDEYEMHPKFRLFLMLLPFLALTFVFAYLPLWGWSVSFYDYQAGFELTPDRFVGLKWFTYLFENAATRADIMRVMRNTLAMSGLGLATSWCAMAFAIFLTEIKNTNYRRLIQTLTTVPNFVSWVLIYSFAFALFATNGFINSVLVDLNLLEAPLPFLQSSRNVWLRMLSWGMWKGLGWSAIIYIAAITGIDPQLFEAATVDGAGRFSKIWHITVPSLLPTFFVLLLLQIAAILSNGMEQYYVFKNAMNANTIEVLDLYVYTLGLGSGGASNISLATVIGLMKSVISITLLLFTNRLSKIVRGVTIV